MAKQNIEKTPPKGNIRFSISLSEEQKNAKTEILKHPFNFVVGKAGSGKTLLAVQVALDQYFKGNLIKLLLLGLLYQPKIMDIYQVLNVKKWNLG